VKLISIITVNYNQAAVTEDLLSSIIENNAYSPVEVIVVDNGSTTDPVPHWKTKYPFITFIRSEKNLGFAGGNNLGIAAAKGDYLFLVNNDTIFTGDLVSRLAGTLDMHPGTGMVSPKIVYYDQQDLLQYAGFTPMNYCTAQNRCVGYREKDNGQYDHLSGITAYAHGAAMMVKREAIGKAGLMAENYFLYYEELDWCERIRKAGYTIRVNMQAVIYHRESLSVGKQSSLKEYYMNRNRILFVRRNTSLLNYMFFILYFLSVVTPRNVMLYLFRKQYLFIPVLMKAIWWNFTNDIKSNRLYFPAR
jgi:GT2 family glycosyltransferase